jgi:hypothetical protein
MECVISVTFVLTKKILALTGESAFCKSQKKTVKIISDADPIGPSKLAGKGQEFCMCISPENNFDNP